MKKSAYFLYILLAATLWGCIALFYNELRLIGFSNLQVVFLRVSTALVLMAVYMLCKDPTLFRIRLRDGWMFFGSGVLSLACFNFCYFTAIEQLSASVAATLLYTAPIFVMLMSAILFKETVTCTKLAAVATTFIGCVLVTGAIGGAISSISGVLFGLGSGFGYALYTIFGVYALRRYKTETVTLYTFVFAAISVLPICRPQEMIKTASCDPMGTLIGAVGIGLFACLLPYLLYTKGLTGVKAGQASVMATLEPVVATVIGIVWLGDVLTVPKVIGMVLIIVAVVMLHVRTTEQKPST